MMHNVSEIVNTLYCINSALYNHAFLTNSTDPMPEVGYSVAPTTTYYSQHNNYMQHYPVGTTNPEPPYPADNQPPPAANNQQRQAADYQQPRAANNQPRRPADNQPRLAADGHAPSALRRRSHDPPPNTQTDIPPYEASVVTNQSLRAPESASRPPVGRLDPRAQRVGAASHLAATQSRHGVSIAANVRHNQNPADDNTSRAVGHAVSRPTGQSASRPTGQNSTSRVPRETAGRNADPRVNTRNIEDLALI